MQGKELTTAGENGSRCLFNLAELFQFLNLLLPGRQGSACEVPLGMFGEVVAPHELSVAQWTDVLLFSSVSPFVTSELVRAGKSPIAVLPRTDIRLFSWKGE